MQKVTIKTYAVKHKLSIFNVMKMVNSGKVQSEIVEENGKNVTYILLDGEIEQEIAKNIITVEKSSEARLYTEMKMLSEEVKLLRAEIETLKMRL